MRLVDGRRRVVVENVTPEVDCGRYPAKRVVGETVVVEADVFADGHDEIAAVVRYRRQGETGWCERPMRPLVNDRWRGEFTVTELGRYQFAVEGWVDPFRTWVRDLARRVAAGQDVAVELRSGARLVRAAARRAEGEDRQLLERLARRLAGRQGPERARSEELAAAMARNPDRSLAGSYCRELPVEVDRERGRFSAWYELFPRSAGRRGRHGTFRDVEALLPYVAGMGFDVLYLPPIHPIGRSFRKGRNNAVEAAPGDPGSPWAIGSEEGGHRDVNPELGTLADFRRLVRRAGEAGLEIALDLAFQCSPDHPYVREHPEWFRWRPDGTVQYAENPPKKYQDIYPFDFETPAWRSLWEELTGVVLHWVAQGVRIFRVDNPHTKPFAFWEHLISEVRRRHPDVIFLSEAFTHPKVMYRLAKLGFTQSYTYFAWRNEAWELRQYFTELTRTEVAEFFRPNLWPNTPDILTEYLQRGGGRASAVRAVLAATLGASWGVYGPAFELAETTPLTPGREEYLDSEKYQLRAWDLDREDGLRGLLARLNAIRRAHPALQQDRTLRFLRTDNEQLLAYAKTDPAGGDLVVVVANLDWRNLQSGWVELPLEAAGPYRVEDLLNGPAYDWSGDWNYVEVRPAEFPAHVLAVPGRLREKAP
jgi:starch synthase (maltosyl-transferring)